MTSPIQTRLSSAPLNQLSDESLLNTYIEAWEYVCKENDAHSAYVEEKYLQQWYSYRDKTTERLRQVIVDFYLVQELTQEDYDWLLKESERIIKAKVKTEETLKGEHSERERQKAPQKPQEARTAPTDPYERQAVLEKSEAQRGWLKRLGGAIFKGQ